MVVSPFLPILTLEKKFSKNSYFGKKIESSQRSILWGLSGGFSGGSAGKNPPAMRELQETWVQSLGQEDPLEKRMATHSSILAWRISWTEETGRLWSTGPQSQT